MTYEAQSPAVLADLHFREVRGGHRVDQGFDLGQVHPDLAEGAAPGSAQGEGIVAVSRAPRRFVSVPISTPYGERDGSCPCRSPGRSPTSWSRMSFTARAGSDSGRWS